MTKKINKEHSLELLKLLQEVKLEIETNTNIKMTLRNNAKKTKIFLKIQGTKQTQKYLFTFKDNWTITSIILNGNWKRPKGSYSSKVALVSTNSDTINFVKKAANWL